MKAAEKAKQEAKIAAAEEREKQDEEAATPTMSVDTTKKMVEDCKAKFNLLDTDSNGSLSVDEVAIRTVTVTLALTLTHCSNPNPNLNSVL